MRPATVDVADNTLRCFAGFLVDSHPEIVGFVDVRRTHVEGFKVFFAAHSTVKGVPPARNTIRQRLGMLRSFFDRIIEWDWPDAPTRMPIFAVDVPVADDPLPRFLDDAQAARFAAAAAVAVPFERLVIELLSRTGMRVGELCTLAGDAVVVLNGTPWLRIPVGKLHNDRYVPLHPNAARLLTDWTAATPTARRTAAAPRRRRTSTATRSDGSCARSADAPASVTSTRTSCATPSRPRRSTVGCGSRRSPRCSAIAACE